MTLREYLSKLKFADKKIEIIIEKCRLSDDEDGIAYFNNKIEEYQRLLKATRSEILRMARLIPQVLSCAVNDDSATSAKNKIAHYCEILHLPLDVACQKVRTHPSLLCLDTIAEDGTSVKGKIRDYEKILGISHEDAIKIIGIAPALLSYDTVGEAEPAVKGKVNSYCKILGRCKNDIVQMILRNPSILGLDTKGDTQTSVKTKIGILTKFIPVETIVENPTILNAPAQRVKLRYLILSDLWNDEFPYRYLMQSEQVSYARRCYLKEKGKKLTLRRICCSKSDFEKFVGEIDISQYPITEEVINNLEAKYFEREGVELCLTDEEKQATLGENDLN